MKILALNGSHRGKNGCTQWLLDKLSAGVINAGADFETVVLIQKSIKPCIGCQTCQTAETKYHCIYETEDDVQDIFEKMRCADIIIYATPVYIFSISGIMKTFMDRFNSTAGSGELCLTQAGLLFHRIETDIYKKPFVVLTCCGNIEHETVKNILSYFETFSRFLDAPIVGRLVRKMAGVLESTHNQTEKQKKIIEDIAEAYYQAGQELAVSGRIATRTEKRANQNILGFPCLDVLLKFQLFKKLALRYAPNHKKN